MALNGRPCLQLILSDILLQNYPPQIVGATLRKISDYHDYKIADSLVRQFKFLMYSVVAISI